MGTETRLAEIGPAELQMTELEEIESMLTPEDKIIIGIVVQALVFNWLLSS